MDRVEGDVGSVDENILRRRKLEPESRPDRKSIDHRVSARIREGVGDCRRVQRMLVVIRDHAWERKKIPAVEDRINFLGGKVVSENQSGGVESAPQGN